MFNIKNDIMNTLQIRTNIELMPILNLKNNTSDIYELSIDDNNYICKVYDIIKESTKKYMAINEVYFYENFKYNVENILKILKCSGIIKNENNEKYAIILEKIENVVYDDILELIYKIIIDISKLHIFYWNSNIENIMNYENNSVFIINEKVKKDILYYFENIKNIFEDKMYNKFKIILNKNESSEIKDALAEKLIESPVARPWRIIKATIFSLFEYNGEFSDIIKEVKKSLRRKLREALSDSSNF
jgi:phosphotransferase system IIB component